MTPLLAAFAKLAGIRKAVALALDDEHGRRGGRPYQNFPFDEVGHYFTGAGEAITVLIAELPLLFEGFRLGPPAPLVDMGPDQEWRYSRQQLIRLDRDIDQIFEIRANSELAAPARELPRRVFLSHGRAEDWRAVQAFIEKDIGLATLELAQEANAGRTITAHLNSA